jgi:hypothetical protein
MKLPFSHRGHRGHRDNAEALLHSSLCPLCPLWLILYCIATPTTLLQLARFDGADFSLSGQDFEIAPLKNGALNFLNRTYV